MKETSVEDRCRGVLVGLAAGDRIGGPTRMALPLADSLIACGGFDPADVLARYVAWWRDGAFDTGPVSDRALALVAAGVPVRDATAQVHRESGGMTAGCNPAHRSPPLAMLAAISDEDLADRTRTEAGLTHHDPVAGEVATEVTSLCRALVRGVRWDVAVTACLRAGEDGPGSVSGYAPDVLRAARHFVGGSAGFAEGLARSLGFAGPANYCPVLVGALGGARWGASAVPRAALAHVEVLPRVEATADALAAGWATSGA